MKPMRPAVLVLALSSALVLATPSSGLAQEGTQGQIELAREHMEQGQELYLQGRFIEAAEEFQRAYEAQPFGAFLYNAAVAYEHQREWVRAGEFFSRYLEREPNAPDAAEVLARIEQLRARAAAEAAPAVTETPEGETPEGETPEGETPEGETPEGETPEGETPEGETVVPVPVPVDETPAEMKSMLYVLTEPEGAEVQLLRGERVVAHGPTPFAQTLAQGEYRVVVEHSDYRRIEDRVTVHPGVVHRIIGHMRQGQFLGYLRVETDVPGANVYIDDREAGAVGQTPYPTSIPTGPHVIWIERPGYQPIEREIEIGMGEDVTLREDLLRVDHGRLQVIANVRSATVFVDDRQVGTVPYDGEVGPGPRRVRVEADDMKDWEETVTVRQGQLTPVRVRLRPAVGRGGAWVTATLAAILVGGGAVMGVLASNLEDDLNTLRSEGRLASNDPRLFEGQLLSIGADVAFGAGTVLGLLAVYYFLRDPLPDSEGRTLEPRDWALSPHVSGDGAGASLGWRF